MLWGKFLHIYQPHGQDPDVLEAIVNQCYHPVIKGILDHEDAKLTLNVNAALLELFDYYNYNYLIDMLKEGGKQGKIEFTGSAKYHALLPFLPHEEMVRQITANNETNRHYLGDVYQPKGIFLPEMAYSPDVPPALEETGFDWVLLDEIAHQGKVDTIDATRLYTIKGTNLGVFFRERGISNVIMSAAVRSKDKLVEVMEEDLASSRYVITGMDGETFGHHRVGLESLLFEIFDAPEFDLVKISDLLTEYTETEEVEPVSSTWASSPEDIEEGVQFLTWSDPSNEIHQLQWQLRDLVLEQFYKLPQDNDVYGELREKLDSALASDQFFWASAKPWWSIEMIEEGAYALLEIIQKQPGVDSDVQRRALDYYNRILENAFEWKRSGKITQLRQQRKDTVRIPFRERTVEEGGPEEGVYRAFMDMMKEQEQQAAERADYEEAIIWRDAMYKLEHKLDVYDAVHAADLLRTRISNEDVEQTIQQYKQQYSRIRSGQPEQRG